MYVWMCGGCHTFLASNVHWLLFYFHLKLAPYWRKNGRRLSATGSNVFKNGQCFSASGSRRPGKLRLKKYIEATIFITMTIGPDMKNKLIKKLNKISTRNWAILFQHLFPSATVCHVGMQAVLVRWCSGYHVCFTRRRSPVRPWHGSQVFCHRLDWLPNILSGWPSGLRRQTQGSSLVPQ